MKTMHSVMGVFLLCAEILSTLRPFSKMFFNMSHHGTRGGLNKVGIIAYLETT